MFLKQPIEISKNNNLNQFEKPPNSLEQIQNLMLIISSWVTWWFTPGTMEFTPVSTLPIPCYRQIRWGVLTPNHHQISMFHGWIPWTITMKSACFMVESHEQSPWNYHEITVKSPWFAGEFPTSKPTHHLHTMTESSSWFGTSAAAGAAASGAAGGWFGGLFGGTDGRVDGPWCPVGFVKARRTGFMVMKQHIKQLFGLMN